MKNGLIIILAFCCSCAEAATMYRSNVTSLATGVVRIESALFAAPAASACVVTETTGDWINGNATSGQTGKCSATINAGVFSSPPSCVCSVSDSSGGGNMCVVITATTTSLEMQDTNNAGTAENRQLSAICIGPR